VDSYRRLEHSNCHAETAGGRSEAGRRIDAAYIWREGDGSLPGISSDIGRGKNTNDQEAMAPYRYDDLLESDLI
jgi:hypothetical protein